MKAAKLSGHVVGAAVKETQWCFAAFSDHFYFSAAGKAFQNPALNGGSSCSRLRRNAAA